LQSKIIYAYNLIAKWTLSGDWIQDDLGTQRLVITALAKGISILDRENEFSFTNPINETTNFEFSNSFGLPPGAAKPQDSSRGESVSGTFTSSTMSPTLRSKKGPSRMALAPNKRFPKLFDIKLAGNNASSTATKEEDVGLPTFAVLSAEIQIKTAAEHALNLICLRLANFPPNNSCFGLSYLSSAWDDINTAMNLSKFQSSSCTNSTPINELTSNFVHYYDYQKRLILGIVENPDWHSEDPKMKEPSIVMVIRDPGGKYSWIGEFKYVDSNANIVGKSSSADGKISDDLDHFLPHAHPVIPPGRIVPISKCENGANIPSLEDCCNEFAFFDLQKELRNINEYEVLESTGELASK
jgi:hypothetical protein